MNRKQFIKQSFFTIALASAGITTLNFADKRFVFQNANDRIRIGVIGINGMGWTNTLSLFKGSEY